MAGNMWEGDCEGILPEVTIIEERVGHENLGQQNIRTIGEKRKPNAMSQRSVVKDSKEGKSFPPFIGSNGKCYKTEEILSAHQVGVKPNPI